MRRLTLILGLLAALAGGAALLGCPFFHGDYPPSGNECTKNTDCFSYETCSDAGACQLQEQPDAGGGE